jgi:hypothetical protein
MEHEDALHLLLWMGRHVSRVVGATKAYGLPAGAELRKDGKVIGGGGKSKGEKNRGREILAENTEAHRDLLPWPAVATNSIGHEDRKIYSAALFNVCFAPYFWGQVKAALLRGPGMPGRRTGAFASTQTA